MVDDTMQREDAVSPGNPRAIAPGMSDIRSPCAAGPDLRARPDDREPADPGKRRFTRLAVLLAPTTAVTLLGVPRMAGAANARLPAAVRSLDDAGMALFDAAEAADWAGAGPALERAKAAAVQVDGLKWTFVDAGGAIGRFIEVQNNLGADLIEANLALSTKDQRWLISSADRIDSRAGELSQPFLQPGDQLAARVDTLLFLARRMRRALVWHDEAGYRQAADDFSRVSEPLLRESDRRTAGRSQAVASALKRLGSAPSSADLKSLRAAILGPRVAPAASTLDPGRS